MPNQFQLAGSQNTKPAKFSCIYTGRFSSGIWTNRSPLRDANTSRLVEKFYGAAGDALIAGSNVEITNKLTMARRPGSSVFDSNSYTNVDRFYEFRLSNPSTEVIKVMVDQSNAIYSLFNGVKTLVFTKTAGAGQAFFQSVGNTLYFADGTDNKKWLQSLVTWSAFEQWNTPGQNPFFTTFLIDPNGNIQQLTGTTFPVTNINVTNDTLTVTSSITLTGVLSVGTVVTFPPTMAATFLENQNVTILTVTTNTFTATISNANYSGAESINATAINGGTPTSGATQPTWSTVVPSAANDFHGGITIDGTAQWTNRGNPIENWGIQGPTIPVVPSIGQALNSVWQANTFYSLASVVIDSNGNLQQVSTSGTSATNQPTWNTTPFATTADGSAVWTLIETAAQLNWQASFAYKPPSNITGVTSSSGGSAVYTGLINGGAANALAGLTFLVSGFTDNVNNGIFVCTASTATSLTLSNGSATAESASITATAVQQQTIQYVVGNASGTNALFKLTSATQPSLNGAVSAYLYPHSHSANVGQFVLTFPTSTGSATQSTTSQNSLQFVGNSGPSPLSWDIINGAGAVTGTNTPFSVSSDYSLIILANINFPVSGQYSINIVHHDGCIWGMGGGATLVSGTSNNPIGQTQTANMGYPIFGGTNTAVNAGTSINDQFVINIPTPGVYPVEFDYAYWFHSGQIFTVTCNSNPLANGTPQSGTTQPSWPTFSTSFAPSYATIAESAGQILWSNIGPTTDFSWAGNKVVTTPDTLITDTNGFVEAPFRTGYSGTVQPTWATGINSLTADNPNLIWINEGGATALPNGTLSTFNGGWKYSIALVNTLDNTVSNGTPLSVSTGNFVGAKSITIPPGSGLPPLSQIDPQVDYVAIFRTTDGQSTPFLIPGASTVYTIPLWQYILNGYTDTTPDTGLNNLIQAPLAGENTPPAIGAKNLAFHLNRIFYSVGNVVYYTSGPDTPVGNGLNGTSPLNFDALPSSVSRIVPTASGAIVFTVSDVYIIQGNGTSSNPIQSALPLLPGIGLLSYNALDLNGPQIGLFTTDGQFVVLDPTNGTNYVSLPIGDQLRLNNGTPGQSWNPANVYVSFHVQGEDMAWYVADGQFGWYRLMTTPAPETGYTWSPFSNIVGGVKAVQSVEVSPGVHRLLLGPIATGELLQRDLTVFTDNGSPYPANATIGSAVLAQPGQIAMVSFIVTDSVRVGLPLVLGLLIDEALPYYTGPIDILKQWENDPPNLKPSRSLYGQRFYLSQNSDEVAVMRHCQIQVIWSPTDTVQNELLSLSVYGGYQQEG